MRTTVTLDPDVERLLKEAAHQTHRSFKEVLNDAVRKAHSQESALVSDQRFEVKATPMGLRTGLDPSTLGKLADDLEIDAFLALSARLARNES